MRPSTDGHCQEGYILVFVLWAVALLLSSALLFVASEKINSRATYAVRTQALARASALRAFSEAVMYLESDKDPRVDYIDREGRLRVDPQTEPFPQVLNYDSTEVQVTIMDELSRVNINYAPRPLIRGLLLRLGYEPDRVSEMMDCLLDWIDTDRLHRLQGAEDEFYETLGYTAKNSPIDDIGELALIKAFGPEVLRGDDEHPALSPHITVFGRGGININTVSEETLYLLGLSQEDVQAIITSRQAEGIRVLTQEMFNLGLNRTSSDLFRVSVTAYLKTDPTLRYNIISVLRRVPYRGRYKTEVLYWKEDEFYTGH